MMAICYREGGDELLEAYQNELKEKYGLNKLSKDLSGMFTGLDFGGAGTSSLFGTTSASPAATFFGPPFHPPTGGFFGSHLPLPTGGLFGAFGSLGMGALKTIKKKKKKAPEIKREKMKGSVFTNTTPLNNLKWSPWKQVMSHCDFPKAQKTKSVGGYLAKLICPRDYDLPGVFEFAVNPFCRKKKYVVYYNITKGLPCPCKWYQRLVGKKYQKEKFRQAIAQSATVFVRRGRYKSRNQKTMEEVSDALEDINYVFGTSKRNARAFKVKGLSI